MEEKRLIVEATRRDGVSVAAVAQAHGVNANQVFYWRKLYDAGQLTCETPSPVVEMAPARVCLLPVTVEGEQPQELVAECKADQRTSSCSSEGSIELTLARGQVRIAGVVDAGTLRTVLRCLLARVCFSWPARRSDQAALIRWRWPLFVFEEARAGTICMAAGRQW